MRNEVPEVYADLLALTVKWLYNVPKDPLDWEKRIAWSQGLDADLIKLKEKYDTSRKKSN